jgi:geranylgeranyl pyrophosphate synthase
MTLDAGGKRLRPLLTLMCARSDRDLEGRVLHAAVAVELLHMATLVHDDVLDRADLRRGSPTVARAFGSMTALSTGNLLLARAFSEIARTGDAEAVEVLSAAAVALSEGEVMQRDQARDLSLTQPEYERRCERKTADLFSVSCRLGSRLSGMEEKATSALAEYGRLIGLAFQIFDDILDCSGDAASTGKIPGADVRDGTMTLPLMFALEAEPWLSEVLSKEEPGADEVATVLRTVATSGALERAWSVAMRYIEAALTIVETCPGPVERDLLAQVAAQVVARHR